MTIRKRFLVWAVVGAVTAGVVGLWAGMARARLAEASRQWRLATDLRHRVLVQALYARDLHAAAGGPAAGETGQLLLREVGGLGELFGRLDESTRDDGGDGVRPAVRSAVGAWPLLAEELTSLAHGEPRVTGADLDVRCIDLANRLGDLTAACEAAWTRASLSLLWAVWLGVAAGAALVAALAWGVWRSVLWPLSLIGDRIRPLVSGGASLNVRLEQDSQDEVGDLAGILNLLLDRLREEDLQKDRFLANMSHEIRTPMNGIVGFLENLTATELNEQQRQYVRVVQSSARAMLRVISDVLDFSKLAAGRMELESVAFDLEALLRELQLVARQMAQGKGVAVRLDVAAGQQTVVRGDPTRLRQVLMNLLNNAVKFTERGDVCLRASFDSEGEGRVGVTFEVSDTGIGIHPDTLRRLFRPFAQAEVGTTRKYGGTGLGLCIAHNLVSLMGGQLRVESQLGQGTRFWFRIVTTTARPEEKVCLSDQFVIRLAAGALRRYWALIVDDNPTNLFLMETICQGIGLPYMTAVNGREAVEKASKYHFDLIFMDIQMPIMDGYAAIRAIRQLENAAATQIVALTASAMQDDVDRALGAGSTGFLAKPFERNQLLLCIAEHLGVPFERDLKPMPDLRETPAEVSLREIYDFMREQYQVSLGEIKLILAQAVANWRPQLDDIVVFGKKGNWTAVRTIMHTLKGQLGAIGLPKLAETADQVLVRLRNDQCQDILPVLEQFVDELGSVFRAIEQETTVDKRVHPRGGDPAAAGR